MITLTSCEGEPFKLFVEAAKLSKTLESAILEGDCPDGGIIPLHTISSNALSKAVEYCIKHAEVVARGAGGITSNNSDDAASGGSSRASPAPTHSADAASSSSSSCPTPAATKDEIEEWDKDFIERLDLGSLISLIPTARHLGIPGLFDLACNHVADMTKGMSTEQMRQTFGIVNDFTKEEDAIRKEHGWALKDI